MSEDPLSERQNPRHIDRSHRFPTFLIIGAGRSGTSSLSDYLQQHPDIYVSPIKEPRFFAFDEDTAPEKPRRRDVYEQSVTTKEEYLRLFDDVSTHEHWGEASSTYLHNEESPRRIFETIPNVRLIAILRNPIERAYSHYGLNVRLGRREEGRFGRWVRDVTPGDPFWEKYIVPGFYSEQLSRYRNYFGEDQLSVHLFNEFANETSKVVTEIFGFLGVDPSFEPDLSVQRNTSGVPRFRYLYRLMEGRREPAATLKRVLPTPIQRFFVKLRDRLLRDRSDMSDEARQRLREIYREDIRQLQELLGRELSHWR